jgi:hypothetical protein
MSKFAGLSLECVAAQAQAEVGRMFERVLSNNKSVPSNCSSALCLSIEDQMKLLHESQILSTCAQVQPLRVQLQLMQFKVFHGSVLRSEAFSGLEVTCVRRPDGSSCSLYLPSEFARLCADLLSPGRGVRWAARASSAPVIPDTSTPLFSPGESLALVLKPHASEKDALFVELLNAGDLGSACAATVLQVMQPQHSSKYRAGLVRVLLCIHNCCDCEGTVKSDCMGVLLLWDRQLSIAALFEEGDTLLLQSPVWVSSYDADDVADWACGTANPILLEVGPQSVLFVHPAQLHSFGLSMMAGKLSLSTQPWGVEHASFAPSLSMKVNLHSCTSARIVTHAARAPVAVVDDAAAAETVVCPRIEALGLTFVHALPLQLLLCDAAPGMRGLCCMVQILGGEAVHLESASRVQASAGADKIGIICQGWGRGCDVLIVGAGCPEDSRCRHRMYKISDGWASCHLILPLAAHNPASLIHKTVLLHGFDCREFVSQRDAASGFQNSSLFPRIVLMPHSSFRVLPISLNIGLALSAAAHDETFSSIVSAMPVSGGAASIAAVPRACSGNLSWLPAHTVTASLVSVFEGHGSEGCRVALQDKYGQVIQLPCSSLHPQLLVGQLLPLVGSSVVCVITPERSGGQFQIESMYRC